MIIRSRIAPTPSGYVHLGNAVNFLLAWAMTRARKGALKLRIDDADGGRTRPAYVDDIFRQLEWLGIDWDEGPQTPDEFRRRHSQRLRVDRYREALAQLREAGHVFACTCTRSRLRAAGAEVYPGTCRGRPAPEREEFAWRLRVPPETTVTVQGTTVQVGRQMGDFIVWRRDDAPAYQLASVVDDVDDRINFIVRGQDLWESTAAQLFLAGKLEGAERFRHVTFHHHRLIAGTDGRKLSKSDDAYSLAAYRQAGGAAADVYRAAAKMLGFDGEAITRPDDMLALYTAKAE